MSTNRNDKDGGERPRLLTRVTRGLSFMNKVALVILVLGCLAVAFKHS